MIPGLSRVDDLCLISADSASRWSSAIRVRDRSCQAEKAWSACTLNGCGSPSGGAATSGMPVCQPPAKARPFIHRGGSPCVGDSAHPEDPVRAPRVSAVRRPSRRWAARCPAGAASAASTGPATPQAGPCPARFGTASGRGMLPCTCHCRGTKGENEMMLTLPTDPWWDRLDGCALEGSS